MKEIKTYSVRLFPNKMIERQLNHLSVIRNTIYNELVDIEQTEYDNTKKILSEYDLNYRLPGLKSEHPEYKVLHSKACQRISSEVFGSYKSFFNIVKRDNTAHPPKRIEDIEVFHTIAFNQCGWKFKEKTLLLNGIEIPYKGKSGVDYQSLKVKEVRLKKKNGKYLLDFSIETLMPEPEEITVNNRILAIDLGIKNIVNGIDNQEHWVTIPNKAKKVNNYFRKQIAKIQKKMSVCKKGSNRYDRLKKTRKKLYKRRDAQVKQTLHIQSKKLANMNYKTIVVGELSVKKLMGTTDNKLRKTSRSFGETSIAMFLEYLKYKCLIRNCEVETISERWTTQQNCLTGRLFKEKIDLSVRVVSLSDSITVDRDLNAAINIMKRYEQNHIALLTEPLDVSSVVGKYNLLTNTCS